MRIVWSGWRGLRNLNHHYSDMSFAICCLEQRHQHEDNANFAAFHSNSFTPMHTSIHLTASRFSCELVWTEKASWVNGKSLVNFAFIFFRHFTAWESEMTAYILLGTVSRSAVKGSLWFEDIVWMELSRLFLLYMLVHSLWLPNGVKAYQKPHQSRRLSGAFMGCSSASRAVV